VPGGGDRLKHCRIAAAHAGLACSVAALLLLCGSRGLQNAVAEGDTRSISLHHMHTDENITITYKRNGQYDEAALEKLNWLLRDWRRNQQTRMDPHLIDVIWEVHRETGAKEPVWVVCGYRSPETNAMLRKRSRGVARFSQHMLGHAMDFYIPGVPLDQVRAAGLRLQRGGVGFYPTSGSPFVHLDTGSIRHWPRMTHEQLARVFPDGRTVHVPSDGRPLSGYAVALADVKRHGSSPSEMSLDAARGAGMNVEVAGVERSGGNRFLKLLGIGKHNDEEEEADASGSAPPEPASPPAGPSLRARAKAAVVAAVGRAEDKVAAEKTKLAQMVGKMRVVRRAEAAPAEAAPAAAPAPVAAAPAPAPPVAPAAAQAAAPAAPAAAASASTNATTETATGSAADTPHDIIVARGFWQGLPDGMSAAQPTAVTTKAVTGDARARRTGPVLADADPTGTLTPWPEEAIDRAPSGLSLAYAEPAGRDAPAAVQKPRATAGVATRADGDEMTIAVKRVGDRPASAVLTVTNRKSPALADGKRLNDPWLRAVVLSPSVSRFLTAATLGARDFRTLAALIEKPASSVMMTFAAEPNPSLDHDHFSGSAIVFVPTVTYPTRTASLH
jgi:uncharacterized protein YcbK (DUF882 family)